MKLLIATTNPNKVREIRSMLSALPIDLCTLADVPPIAAPPESGATFWENAREKALSYALDPDEIIEFWRRRQIEDRNAGRDHYTVLIDAATNTVVCAID